MFKRILDKAINVFNEGLFWSLRNLIKLIALILTGTSEQVPCALSRKESGGYKSIKCLCGRGRRTRAWKKLKPPYIKQSTSSNVGVLLFCGTTNPSLSCVNFFAKIRNLQARSI